jgi:hypothetical protein
MLFITAAVVAGCGGTTAAPTPAAGFAGTYATAVSLLTTTCGAITVQNNPTTVTFDAGTRAATFTHAGTTYSGTVAADSTFSTTPRTVNVNDGFVYTIGIAGKFQPGGFDATATVDRAATGSTCRFTVRWAGTRS